MENDGYEKVTTTHGFNHWDTEGRVVEDDDDVFLERGGRMIYLGTFIEAKNRAGRSNDILGIDRTNYGTYYGPYAIGDNLFVRRRTPYSQALASSITGRQMNTTGAYHIMQYLEGPNKVDKLVFRNYKGENAKGFRNRKTKRYNRKSKRHNNRRKTTRLR